MYTAASHGFSRPRGRRGARAFTMLEMLIVIGIIAILASALLVAGTKLIEGGKAKKTRFMLTIVRDALEEFRQEQRDKPTLTKPAKYVHRYGYYPPDELEVFTADGIPHGPPGGSRAVGGYEVIPGPASSVVYADMLFYMDGLPEGAAASEHRDLAAMVLALQMFSETASSMLDKLASSDWQLPLDTAGKPLQYLDRNGNQTFETLEDEAIRYLVDAWGVPLTYLTQRDFDPEAPPDATVSTNYEAAWNAASTAMVRLNGGQPILCSYGSDGRDQLSKDLVTATAPEPRATLVTDWEDDGRINSPLNDDNVYPDAELNERLHRGKP